jgi:hypothetical protein
MIQVNHNSHLDRLNTYSNTTWDMLSLDETRLLEQAGRSPLPISAKVSPPKAHSLSLHDSRNTEPETSKRSPNRPALYSKHHTRSILKSASVGSPIKSRPYFRSPVRFSVEDEIEDYEPEPNFETNGSRESSIEVPKSPFKRVHSPMKKMFGENGWLSRSTTSLNQLPSESPRKSGFKNWYSKQKGKVENIVSLIDTVRYRGVVLICIVPTDRRDCKEDLPGLPS